MYPRPASSQLPTVVYTSLRLCVRDEDMEAASKGNNEGRGGQRRMEEHGYTPGPMMKAEILPEVLHHALSWCRMGLMCMLRSSQGCFGGVTCLAMARLGKAVDNGHRFGKDQNGLIGAQTTLAKIHRLSWASTYHATTARGSELPLEDW